MYKIIISNEVDDDIDKISEYILRSTFDYNISKKVVKQLYSEIFSLKIFPLRYQKYYKDYYVINLKSYRIFYVVDEENKVVSIVRIFGTAQDFQSYI